MSLLIVNTLPQDHEGARAAFADNDNILFAIPLFVENVPGILLEFLQTLTPKTVPGTKLAFLLQGGFAEASQLRCGEAFLQALPGKLGCAYAGTLIKGNMFALAMVPPKAAEKMASPFIPMGRLFAKEGRFHREAVDRFAAPEHMSKGMIGYYNFIGGKLSKLFFDRFARARGCKEPLDAKPYLDSVNAKQG